MKKLGRKQIICSRCFKEKLNFGFNMCNACLRHYKRQTRPSFYLGTCYSELSRRVKTFDPKRPNYFGKLKCSKDEFINKFINDENFLNLYKNWQQLGFKRKIAPSIDRINNELGYLIENLQFIIQGHNSKKDWQYNIEIKYGNNVINFESQQAAEKHLGLYKGYLSKLLKNTNKANYRGMTIKRTNV